MRKRLIIGLAAGALVAAMLPGTASATPGNPDVWNFGMCNRDADYMYTVYGKKGADPAEGGPGPSAHNKNNVNFTNGKPFDWPVRCAYS